MKHGLWACTTLVVTIGVIGGREAGLGARGVLSAQTAQAAPGTQGPDTESATLAALVERASQAAAAYVELISKMNCAEHVTQFKLDDAGKPIDKQESNFDYLVLLNQGGGDLSLVESRLPVPADRDRNGKGTARSSGGPTTRKAGPPLLLSNGFSLLFLIFHPYYAPGFEFSLGEPAMFAGRRFATIKFRHISGTRSPAAMAVRGREYQLDMAGTALVDPPSGAVVKITAALDVTMQDVGLRTFASTIDYAPVTVRGDFYWLPSQVTVDVESRRQHWRNIHQFSKYKRFGVNTNEQVKTP